MGIIFFIVLSSVGAYFILTEYLLMPSKGARKAITVSKVKDDRRLLDVIIEPMARMLEKSFPWNEYQLERLGQTLKTIGETVSARRYSANALSKSIVVGAFAFPMMLLSPLLLFPPIIFAVIAFIKQMSEPDKLLKIKRERIEAELPKFASTIANSLFTTKDVIKILRSYRKVCGDELREELDITLADMKTGTDETALRKLEERIGSTKLNALVRGLLSVLRGEDQILYFQIKNEELRKEHIERQRREIIMRPGKLNSAMLITFLLIVVMLVYVLVYQIMGNTTLF